MIELPVTMTVLAELMTLTRTPGALLTVARDGVVLVDVAVGQRVDGRPLRTSDWVPWYSASKLPATVAVACAWEQGLLDPTDRVVDHLPEFGYGAKDTIRIEHLLAHTAPLRTVDREVGGTLREGRRAALDRITSSRADPGWEPGQRAGYLGHVGYLLLDEIVARRSGLTFAEFQRRHVLAPLGLMSDLGPPTGHDVLEVPWLGDPRLAARVAGHSLALRFPSACVAGPFHESLRIVDALLRGGRLGELMLLDPATCTELLRDHRPADLIDESVGRPRRWGLGVALGQVNWGPASASSFGALGGTACSVVADPAVGISVALYFLGNVQPDERLRRDQLVHAAVWRDLGIT